MSRKLREKLSSSTDVDSLGPESDYGFFLPNETGSKSGNWLKDDQNLESIMGGKFGFTLKSGVNIQSI